jgi:chromosome segregation ATPase
MGATTILLAFLAAAVAWIFVQSRQVSGLQEQVKSLDQTKEERRAEAEAARKDAREKREELERTKEELQEARSKLRKKSAGEKPGSSQSTRPAAAAEASTVSTVRISDQELEEQHREATERLSLRIRELEDEVEALRRKEAERAQAVAKAQERAAKAAASAPEPPRAEPARAEDQIEALKVQIEALERSAHERERNLKRDLDRAQGELRSAERRASANHQLYQVAKGQMAVIEDRLAALRKKYEGAVSPDQLKKPEPPAEAEAAPAAEEEAPPATSTDASSGGEGSSPVEARSL